MEQGTLRDVAVVTAELLNANDRKLAESQAKLQVDFENHEARFNAELAALVPLRQKDEAMLRPERWLLARKCWAWLHHD
jgi:hypothetical protein